MMKRRTRGPVVYSKPKKGKVNRLSVDKRPRDNHDNDNEDLISSDEEFHEPDLTASTISQQDENNGLEKRLKLAKKYIDEIKYQENVEEDQTDIDPIATRLEEEILTKAGIKQQTFTDHLCIHDSIKLEHIIKMSKSITCISVGKELFFVGSKDGNIYKYDVNTNQRLGVITGSKRNLAKNVKTGDICTVSHGHILSLALAHDEKYLASSCENKFVYVWDPKTLEHIHTFRGHRDVVSGVAFRIGTHHLYSTSFDRMVKVWNLDDMTYVDTLYGHEDKILSIDSLHKEHALTTGGMDYSVRLFKVDKETQSLYQADSGYFQEYALMMTEEEFISISSNGSLLVWKSNKRKPVCVVDNVHVGRAREGEIFGLAVGSASNTQNKLTPLTPFNGIVNSVMAGKPVYSIALVPYSDLFATGSSDGFIHVWKYSSNQGEIKLEIKRSIQMDGIITCMKFSKSSRKLFVGVSREGRLGRWETAKVANKIVVYSLDLF